jgi:opacity protein-like surface antigen
MPPCRRHLVAVLVLLGLAGARPAAADVTLFLGSALTPSHRAVTGLAVGVSMLVVGFEFEYAGAAEPENGTAPGLRTGLASALVQTPDSMGSVQIYLAASGGLYRETLGADRTTSFALAFGGGAKVALIGPLRLRLDYRLLRLGGTPLHARVHRLYAGVNLKF